MARLGRRGVFSAPSQPQGQTQRHMQSAMHVRFNFRGPSGDLNGLLGRKF